ncbi:MAG: hypothetical protein OXC95_13790 [Dehalococcoidia bacterium]|nr:hypothetical protein [Dehalococcoidia bacterium]
MRSPRRSRGACRICPKAYTYSYMKRHMSTSHTEDEKPSDNATATDNVILGISAGRYWMIIELPALATLYDLDYFLRTVWLECCGHLSGFIPLKGSYGYFPMEVPIAVAFEDKGSLVHHYDMGSTTECLIEFIGVRRIYPTDAQKENQDISCLTRNESDNRLNTPRTGDCGDFGDMPPDPTAAFELLKGSIGPRSVYHHREAGVCCCCHYIPQGQPCPTDQCRECKRTCPCLIGRGSSLMGRGSSLMPRNQVSWTLEQEIARAPKIDLRKTELSDHPVSLP